MSISESELLQFSLGLLSGETEPSWRAAGSRAYYAAFNRSDHLNDFLPDYLDADAQKGGSHMRRIAKFENLAVMPDIGIDREIRRKIASLGMILKDLKILRVKADYYLHEDFDENDAGYACERAKIALSKCEEIYEQLSLIKPDVFPLHSCKKHKGELRGNS